MVMGASVVLLSAQDYPLDEPCPSGVRQLSAVAVHLAPSVVRHQNWVGVAPTELASRDAWIYACTQGMVVGRYLASQVEFDPTSGAAEIKVATRWVDLAWLEGGLDAYRNPAEWTVVYAPVDGS